MSNTDSFIEEVTEEVRRDKLNALVRRWGWLAALIVMSLVGGAAWNEWSKSRAQAEAQGFGDAVIAALESEAPFALENVAAPRDGQQLLKDLLMAGTAANNGARDDAATTLQGLAERADMPTIYRQLALLKAQMAGGTGDAALDAQILDELATPGQPFRPLALEQQALRLIETGDPEGAIDLLRSLSVEQGVTDTLRRRALQLIVALGGTAAPA